MWYMSVLFWGFLSGFLKLSLFGTNDFTKNKDLSFLFFFNTRKYIKPVPFIRLTVIVEMFCVSDLIHDPYVYIYLLCT